MVAPSSVIALPWYRRGDYAALLRLFSDPDKVPANSWVALKLQYTHGYGVVAARANQATTQGDPVLTLQDIPPAGVPAVTQVTMSVPPPALTSEKLAEV